MFERNHRFLSNLSVYAQRQLITSGYKPPQEEGMVLEMTWNDLFPKDRQPSMEDIEDYMGDAKKLWLSLASYFESAYKASPKITYSGCGMKPGWNIKYQKSGQAFGTIYPQKNAFEIMVIISYKLNSLMEETLPLLNKQTADLYREAGDYMKLGKWIMLRVDNEQVLQDYIKIISVKLPPKITEM